VDQWDWERVITKEDRTLEFLKDICAQKNINVLE
jgi:asparagine synthetase A